ncbi:MAG: head GIN domain-containing protein [Erythrobacter sp.]
MLKTLFKNIAPLAVIALGAGLSGCDSNIDIKINDSDGVPLAELDMSGDAPTNLVLAGPDNVVLNEGETLSIDVAGDEEAIELLRFTNEDGTLGIMRENGKWRDSGSAIVTVTMPAADSITIAGSGSVEANVVADEADLTIAGSGSLKVNDVDASEIEATIAGAGSLSASGKTTKLGLNVVGSGSGNMSGLAVDEADVTIAGSGDASFASDGKVVASIVGSGSVRVTGSASCEVDSLGSGSLTCDGGTTKAASDPSEER